VKAGLAETPLEPLAFSLHRWEEIADSLGEPSYRARQLFAWLHARRAASYDAMTDLPETLRERLAKQFPLRLPQVKVSPPAADGAIKYLFIAGDGAEFEAVYLPSGRSASLCISVQAGCSLRCRFCATGRLGLTRNLTAGEMLFQTYHLAREHALSSFRVLLMGMGEPLLNLPAVGEAIHRLRHPTGAALSPRRITLSTVGVRGKLKELARLAPGIGLAISLHFTQDADRRRFMPAAARLSLAHLMEEVQASAADFAKVSLEYLLLDGVNDGLSDARRLIHLAHGGMPPKDAGRASPQELARRFRRRKRFHINLIEYNPVPGIDLAPTPWERAERFQNFLKGAGVVATYRRSRGAEVNAACGMLAGSRRLRTNSRPTV